MRSLWSAHSLRGLLSAAAALALALPAVAAQPWRQQLVAGDTPERLVPVLRREAQGEAQARLVVIVGSGCTGMGPIANDYFRGLERAQVWVLHKPHTRPWVRRDAGDCDAGFVREDRHSRWQADALHALQTLRAAEPERPTWLVGISEGADLLPALGRALGGSLQGLVLLSASGLDPADTVRLQALRLGRRDAWDAIRHAAHSDRPDADIEQGRSLGHWRDLLAWRLFDDLTREPWTVWHWWGDADALIPAEAQTQFVHQATGRALRLCTQRWPGADHGLHSTATGALQPVLWQRLLAHTGSPGCPAP